MHTPILSTGKPQVDVTSAQAVRPPWVHESSAAAYALLAANFPQLVQVSAQRAAITIISLMLLQCAYHFQL